MNSSPPTGSWERPEPLGGPAPGVEFAPYGARLVAAILDWIIIGVVVSLLIIVGYILVGSGATIEGNRITLVDPDARYFPFIFIATFIALLYFPFFWGRGGQTPGMKPFGLRVVRDRDGGPVDWRSALLRLVGLWVATAVMYIGFIWIFIDKRRRGWQDLIAGTVVIKGP